MTKEEIKKWIDRWSKLKPSPQRDMVIRIWSNKKSIYYSNLKIDTQ
jgi:hypothetical protein